MNSKKQIWLFLLVYIGLRLFSYFFSPATPLFSENPVNTGITAAILLSIIYLLWKKDIRGWYAIVLEFILGGSGSYLAIGGISLRTYLLAAAITIYAWQKLKNQEYKAIVKKEKLFLFSVLPLYFVLLLSALRGYFFGHDPRLILSDSIPYFFLLYYFPLKELLIKAKGLPELAFNAVLAAVIGNFLLIIFSFIGFSTHFFVLQDNYYHWFRDVASGKITELPFNFYRIVVNEHLVLTPLLLLFAFGVIARSDEGTTKPRDPSDGQSPSLLNTPPKGIPTLLRYAPFLGMTLLIIVLSVNLTRIYLVALVVGYLVLFAKRYWKRWFLVSFLTLLFFFASFTSIHFTASRGQSLGWELFGLRLQSIATPTIENSSLSRLLLLPKIIEKIKENPLLGSGLGDTVTVYSPIFKKLITTPHFDWGYLEILAELGIMGFIVWLGFVCYLLYRTKIIVFYDKPFYLASASALLTINLTSPALFHMFGIAWITFLMVLYGKDNDNY